MSRAKILSKRRLAARRGKKTCEERKRGIVKKPPMAEGFTREGIILVRRARGVRGR